MIEDTSVNVAKTGSWMDLSSSAPGFLNSGLRPPAPSTSDRAFIVYQNADDAVGEAEVAQLLAKARSVVPAVMNYLFFNSAQVAVVYFGKREVHGEKFGIESGAEDFKIRMLRFLTSEIWPTLLRTDAPDESLGNDFATSQGAVRGGRGVAVRAAGEVTADTAVGSSSAPLGASAGWGSPQPLNTRQTSRENTQELMWFRKSIESRMDVLLYLKPGAQGTKYLKLILNNSAHRIHFDVIDAKEEKYRWDLRMLYTRLMDNLETQKAIDSYESYEASLRYACATAAANVLELERPRQEMLPVTLWGSFRSSTAAMRRRPAGSERSRSDGSDHDDVKVKGARTDDDDNDDSDNDGSVAGTSDGGRVRRGRVGNRQTSSASRDAGARTPDQPSRLRRVCCHNDHSHRRGCCSPPMTQPFSFAKVSPRSLRGAEDSTSGDCPPAIAPLPPACDDPVMRDQTVEATMSSMDADNAAPLLVDGDDGVVDDDTFAAKSRGATLNPSKERHYTWMRNLQRPESTTLDYKSYLAYTAQEIRHRCVKFMCGFLNAYRMGKLVVGVHEIPRRDAEGNLETGKGGRNNIVLHNDLVDQYVVGVRVTEAELEDLQEDVSQQLLCCVPPIPPQTVAIDVVPVVYPSHFAYSSRVLILYEEHNTGLSRDSLKQKSNYAIRFLNPLGLSIIPLGLVDHQLGDFIAEHRAVESMTKSTSSDADDGEDEGSSTTPTTAATPDVGPGDGGRASGPRRKIRSGRKGGRVGATPARPFQRDFLKAEAYIIAATGDPDALTRSDWEAQLSAAIAGARSRCRHFFLQWPTETLGPLIPPQLHVVEVSVDIERCPCAALRSYTGKFFAGWPSIPIWDAATRSVRRVGRNYNIFGEAPTAREVAALASSMRSISALGTRNTSPRAAAGGLTISTGDADGHERGRHGAAHVLNSPMGYLAISGSASGFHHAGTHYGWSWFTNLQIANNVLAFLYGKRRVHDVLQFRRVHPVWNRVFENRQGTPLVHMIRGTPVGVPMLNNSIEHISRTQYAFLHAGVPPMPLILCRIYEIIGNLPSPYPFVTVPLVQQSFRISPFLIPIFYRQHYFEGTLRISVVLDLRDGVLKTIQLRDGNLILEAIVGMCFEKMNRRQVDRQLERVEEKRLESHAREDAAHGAVHSALYRRYARSFLARRTLQPRLLRSSRGRRLSSTIPSPVLSESTRLAKREVEPNIPLLHFRFLTRRLLEGGGTVGWGERPVVAPAAPPEQLTGRLRRVASWTLQHLLSWYNALLTDAVHLSSFGYCDRSVAFSVADFSEMCQDDVEPGALEFALSKGVHFASSRELCTLHRKAEEWMEV